MRGNGENALVAGFGFKRVTRPYLHLAMQFSFKTDERHLKAWCELVLQLLALTLVPLGCPHFLFAPLQIEARELGYGLIQAHGVGELCDVKAERHWIFDRLRQ